MEVLSPREVSLTHAEVLDFLKGEAKETKRLKHKQTGSLATLRLELISSLESTPAKTLLERSSQGLGSLQVWRDRLKKFNLTDAEELTVLNQCPVSPVEVHLLVENSEERLSEEDVEDIVLVVKDMLGVEEEEEEQEGEGEEEQEEEGEEESKKE